MTETPPQDEVLTHPEAARLLRVGERTLYRLVADGIVPRTLLGGSARYSRNELIRLVQAGTVVVPADSEVV
jgi:putative molybdopterin biosynthesis protein